MNRLFWLIVLLLSFFNKPVSAQGWIKTYYNYNSNYLQTFGQKTQDNGFVMLGYIGISNKDIHITKTDVFGNIQWTYTKNQSFDQYPVAITQLPSDDSYVVLYHENNFNAQLLRVSSTGQLMYDITVNNLGMNVFTGSSNSNMTFTQDNHLLISSQEPDSLGNRTIGLSKLDLSGSVLWTKFYQRPYWQSYSMDVIETNDNHYLLSGLTDTSYTSGGGGDGREIFLIKTDTSGNDLWRKSLNITGNDYGYSVINTSDGGFVLTGYSFLTSNQQMLVAKTDSSGNLLWDWNSGANVSNTTMALGAFENTDGSLSVTGLQANPNMPSLYKLALVKISATGVELMNVNLASGSGIPYGKQVYTNTDGSFTIFGIDIDGAFILTADSTGAIFTNKIVGNVYIDQNMNCIQDIGDLSFANRLVEASKTGLYRYDVSDAAGEYELVVDSGSYSVLLEPISPYIQVCQNPQTVNFNGFYGRDTVDFAVQVLDTCTYMQVDIAPTFLRRCFPSAYYVNYSNMGTADAQNAYVEVLLDPYLTFDSSSIPLTTQTGNLLRFDLGTVPMLSSQQFKIYVTVDCDSTVLGQVHCTEAHIYPDTVCSPNLWNGPILRTSTNCSNDTVFFRIENIGNAMSSTQDFTIIEEHVMLYSSGIQLGAGQFTDIAVPTTLGATYRIEVEQASGYPSVLGDSIVSSNFIGCNVLPVLNSPTIGNQFYNGNVSPFVSVSCRPNIGAYDPNDKQAQPVGYGAQQLINNNTPLNYHIRFQNTGTDTAFNVFVIDTLDAALDPFTIKMGASSHDYSFEIREGGILVVRFDNIMLPDSNVNQEGSNGFFKFQIEQRPNNPVGTTIYNEAAIYFDFNPPIITNRVFHTIGQDFIEVQITGYEHTLQANLDIKVYPNPFDDATTIEVKGQEFEKLHLQVMDLSGKQLMSLESYSNAIQLQRSNLKSGMYIYQLYADDSLINTGKIMVR